MPRPSIAIDRLNNLNAKPGTLRLPMMSDKKVGKMVMSTIIKGMPKPIRRKVKKTTKKMTKKKKK